MLTCDKVAKARKLMDRRKHLVQGLDTGLNVLQLQPARAKVLSNLMNLIIPDDKIEKVDQTESAGSESATTGVFQLIDPPVES
jgi:hypothetical protein